MTARWKSVPRCREDYCGGVMRLARALLECMACGVTRFATPDDVRLARAAWESIDATKEQS